MAPFCVHVLLRQPLSLSLEALGDYAPPMNRAPQFRARIRIFPTAEGGPTHGLFGFPASGVRPVPVEMDGVSGLNTVGFFHTPDTLIRAGEEFEAGASVLSEEVFAPIIRPGIAFRSWDGRFIASGEVLEVYPAQWHHPVA